MQADLQVVWVVKVCAHDTVGRCHYPLLVYDSATTEVEWGTEGDFLKTDLVGQLP